MIAGNGILPLLAARGAKAAGYRVCCVGLRHQYVPQLPEECDEFSIAGMARVGRWIRLLRRWGAKDTVMVGGVGKNSHARTLQRAADDARHHRSYSLVPSATA